MTPKTQQATRLEFAHYFLDLRASVAADGGKVCKSTEWKNFIAHLIENNVLPRQATSWNCPRSLEKEIRDSRNN